MSAARAGAPGHLPRGLALLARVLAAWGRIELAVALLAFCAVVILTAVQITVRYAFAGSIFWAQEVAQLLMLVAYFVGASCVFRRRHYVVVEFLVARLPPRAQRGAYALAQALTVVLCAVVAWTALAEAPHQLRTYSVILHLPRFYAYLPLVVASLSMIATSAYYALAVHALARREPGLSLGALEERVRIA